MSDAAPASIAPMTTANATRTMPINRIVAVDEDEGACASARISGLVMASAPAWLRSGHVLPSGRPAFARYPEVRPSN